MNIDKYILSEEQIAAITEDTSGSITPEQCANFISSIPVAAVGDDKDALLKRVIHLVQWAYLRGRRDERVRTAL